MFPEHWGFLYFVVYMGYVFTFIAGLVTFFIGLLLLIDRILLIKKGNIAIATVIELKEDIDSDKNKTYKPVFKFTTQNNEEIIYEHSRFSSYGTWSIGEEIKVVYPTGSPYEIVLLTYFNSFGLSMLFFIVGFILIVISTGYFGAERFFNSLQ